MNDSEVEAKIKHGKRVSAGITSLAVVLFLIPIGFVVAVYIFWASMMSSMD
ncbi:MAG: hypothetical protein JJE13_03825 [Thermoleophilia bacterium]|nr:hypothetical protein [Thermoleophilia bacterium]